MTPNIFSIAFNYYRLGDEDMLTALWHYVIASVPGVGQAFVDDMCARTTLAPARFVDASDHPLGDKENRPDLLVRCDAWSVCFEHKVNSPLGSLQLERYIALARTRGWKLAVMAKRPLDIPSGVLAASEFVTPSDPAKPRHFLWNDLQPILRAANHPLAIEFADFLEERGLGTFMWGGLGNPFFNAEAAETLRLLYGAVRPVFTSPGVRFMKKATSLIYEVRRPFRHVHLINIGPIESVALELPQLRGPVMALWVWVEHEHPGTSTRMLPSKTGPIEGNGLRIVVSDHDTDPQRSNGGRVVCERSYYTPLGDVLLDSPERCNAAMLGFARSCAEHLKTDLTRLR